MERLFSKIVALVSLFTLFGLVFYDVFNKSSVKKKSIIVNAKNGETPLHGAAADNSLEHISITKYDVVNFKTKHEETMIHWAVAESDVKVVKIILDKGPDVNAKDKSGHTPLHWAAARGETKLIRLLIDAGADIKAKYKRGKIPYDLATDPEVKKLLEP